MSRQKNKPHSYKRVPEPAASTASPLGHKIDGSSKSDNKRGKKEKPVETHHQMDTRRKSMAIAKGENQAGGKGKGRVKAEKADVDMDEAVEEVDVKKGKAISISSDDSDDGEESSDDEVESTAKPKDDEDEGDVFDNGDENLAEDEIDDVRETEYVMVDEIIEHSTTQGNDEDNDEEDEEDVEGAAAQDLCQLEKDNGNDALPEEDLYEDEEEQVVIEKQTKKTVKTNKTQSRKHSETKRHEDVSGRKFSSLDIEKYNAQRIAKENAKAAREAAGADEPVAGDEEDELTSKGSRSTGRTAQAAQKKNESAGKKKNKGHSAKASELTASTTAKSPCSNFKKPGPPKNKTPDRPPKAAKLAPDAEEGEHPAASAPASKPDGQNTDKDDVDEANAITLHHGGRGNKPTTKTTTAKPNPKTSQHGNKDQGAGASSGSEHNPSGQAFFPNPRKDGSTPKPKKGKKDKEERRPSQHAGPMTPQPFLRPTQQSHDSKYVSDSEEVRAHLAETLRHNEVEALKEGGRNARLQQEDAAEGKAYTNPKDELEAPDDNTAASSDGRPHKSASKDNTKGASTSDGHGGSRPEPVFPLPPPPSVNAPNPRSPNYSPTDRGYDGQKSSDKIPGSGDAGQKRLSPDRDHESDKNKPKKKQKKTNCMGHECSPNASEDDKIDDPSYATTMPPILVRSANDIRDQILANARVYYHLTIFKEIWLITSRDRQSGRWRADIVTYADETGPDDNVCRLVQIDGRVDRPAEGWSREAAVAVLERRLERRTARMFDTWDGQDGVAPGHRGAPQMIVKNGVLRHVTAADTAGGST